MESVIVPRCQVHYTVVQYIVVVLLDLLLKASLPRHGCGRVAMPWGPQEAREGVCDALHLLHAAVMDAAEVQNSPVRGACLQHKGSQCGNT